MVEDMNGVQEAAVPQETEQQGIPISKLLEIIGKQYVEWTVEQENVGKLKEQALGIFKQNQSLTEQVKSLMAKPVESTPVPTELVKLQEVNVAKDAEIHMLEKQVHEVAIARDAASVQAQAALADLKKSRDDYQTLQYVCDDLQKKVDAIPVKKPRKV